MEALGFRQYYFQFTLTDYVREGLKPNVPPVAERIETFKRLADRIGKERVIWRFNPLMLGSAAGTKPGPPICGAAGTKPGPPICGAAGMRPGPPVCDAADTAVGPPICDLSIDESLEDFRSQTLGKETAKLPTKSMNFAVVLNFIHKSTTQEITY